MLRSGNVRAPSRRHSPEIDWLDRAESILRSTGSRVTRNRVIVLACLLEAQRALTHAEIEERLLALQSIDRVTLYRVLDWLTHQHLAHRIAGDDRVWRFTSEAPDHTGQHPHFRCLDCGDVICLEPGKPPSVPLPPGYSSQGMELTVTGRCASCAPRQRRGRGRSVRERPQPVRRLRRSSAG
jgi:Fur family ferric uptake transcriptional regulator